MNDDAKQEIQLALEMLRKTIVDNGVSLAVEKSTGDLIFFDTKNYLKERKFSGFIVNIEKYMEK